MDDRRYYVAEAPRRPQGRLHFAETVGACLEWIRTRSSGGVRLAVWAATPPPPDGPDVALALPVEVFAGWREHAAAVVDAWDAAWLLLESAPRPHRAEAREALVDAVAGALAIAAATGVDDGMDLGF